MNSTKFFILLAIWVTLCLNHERGYAVEEPSLIFGHVKVRGDIQQIQRQIGQEFSAEMAVILPEENQTIVLYGTVRFGIFLSFFESGKERLLWKSDVGSLTLGGLIPAPVLATGRLDANPLRDILLCYSVDSGTSNSTEEYEQFLLFFLDGEHKTDPILLSSADWYLRDEEPRYYLASDGKHAGWKRESLVMLTPASEQEDLTVHVWSRVEIFPHPPTNTPASTTFHIDRYRIHGQSAQLIDHVEGTHQATYTQLRSLIKERQEQGNEPLLLRPHSREPLETVKEWFDWWGKPRSAEDEE